jgi:hypothetical protein
VLARRGDASHGVDLKDADLLQLCLEISKAHLVHPQVIARVP